MGVICDRDAEVGLIRGKTVAAIGSPSHGHAHGLLLRDGGVVNEIARKSAGLGAGNASVPLSGDQTEQHETSVAEQADGAAVCQLDSDGCELVKRLSTPSLSLLFQRAAEIALSEPNLLATRLAEAGVEPRLALETAAALMRERKDPPARCKVCRARAACTPAARARKRSWLVLGGAAVSLTSPAEAAVGAGFRNHKLGKKERV